MGDMLYNPDEVRRRSLIHVGDREHARECVLKRESFVYRIFDGAWKYHGGKDGEPMHWMYVICYGAHNILIWDEATETWFVNTTTREWAVKSSGFASAAAHQKKFLPRNVKASPLTVTETDYMVRNGYYAYITKKLST